MDLKELLMQEENLLEYVENSHYADVAEEFEELDLEEQYTFYTKVHVEDFANILVECPPDVIEDIVELLTVSELIPVINELKSDDAVDILGYADFGKEKEVLRKMKRDDQEQYRMLLGYEEDTAGGLMSTEFVALKSNLTVTNAIRKLREIESDNDDYIDIIYIVDEFKKLIGFVPLKRLILSDPDVLISDITSENVISAKASEDQEEVVALVQKYDLIALPVVNNNGVILGIVTVDDAIDVLVEEQSEDYLKFGGVLDDPETDNTIVSSIKARLPWLCINLVTAFLAALVVLSFQDVIDQVVALAVAMPVVAGMGGNAGTQALSVMIRNIAINDASLSTEWKKTYREVFVGLFNGIVTGLVASCVLALFTNNIYLGVVLLIAMIGNLILAGVVGSIIPLLLKKLGFDPALASSIFITTATDIFGFFMFLGLATLFLPYLV